jgi:transposase
MSIYIGIDWSENKHDITFLNDASARVAQLTIEHSVDGFRKFDATRQQLGVAARDCPVALETAHNLVIDFLWNRDYQQVYVVPPSVVKSCRGRYGQSGARTDESDSLLLADLLRTDRARLQPWRPDRAVTRQLRAKISAYHYLTKSLIQQTNRLRAVLLRYYPAALEVFSGLDVQITLAFIQAYPTPQTAAELSWSEFQAFARAQRYPHPKRLTACLARLQADYPQPASAIVDAHCQEALLLAELALKTLRGKRATLREIQSLFLQHPDHAVFDSLPGAGQLLAPALLVKFGDDRQRFPTPESVQALAGTCPVTEQTGKRKTVKFRKACDRDFRDIAQQWAIHSVSQSVWAAGYLTRVRPRCHSDNHAYRCLANRWLAILWKLWQTHQTYDQEYHLQQCAKRRKPRS